MNTPINLALFEESVGYEQLNEELFELNKCSWPCKSKNPGALHGRALKATSGNEKTQTDEIVIIRGTITVSP